VREVPVAVPTDPCLIPELPTSPDLTVTSGGSCPAGYVCLTRASAVDLGTFLREVERVRESLSACPLWTPE
jgi:hypothetical protein